MAGHVVVDAGPLIHLTQADALHLLDAFEVVTIPETVLQEVESGGILDVLSDLDYDAEEAAHSDEDFPTLDRGETAAITLARMHGAILLTDDLSTREKATDLGRWQSYHRRPTRTESERPLSPRRGPPSSTLSATDTRPRYQFRASFRRRIWSPARLARTESAHTAGARRARAGVWRAVGVRSGP